MRDIKAKIHEIYDEMIAWRRDFHAHPELSNKEFRTSGIVMEKLKEFGLDKVENIYGTGVVGLLVGVKPGKCIAIRADMDALPVQEATGLPFASETPGVMHACGHDTHVAMLLCAAKALAGMRDEIPGSVKFIFQPAEEVAPLGGAKPMVEAGAMENPHVDAIITTHISPSLTNSGAIGLYKGVLTTSFDLYDISITGQSGHGSQPHTAHDAILAASQFVVTAQQIVARRINPLKTAIVSIGLISGGSAVNIIPGSAKLEMCTRTYDDEARRITKEQVYKIAKGIEEISECKFEIKHVEGYGSIKNDPGLVDCAKRAIQKELGEDGYFYLPEPMSFSEDFSYFGNATGTPCAMLPLYTAPLGQELYSLHDNRCTFQEEALENGVTAMVATVFEYLDN